MKHSADFQAHETAVIDEGAIIGAGTRIWHFSHICSSAIIGMGCSFGQNCMVSGGVRIGDRVKVQNNVSIYEGTEIEDEVFLGPSCVLTNVSNPRSQVSRRALYERTQIRRGATVGANATIVCGTTLGRYAFVAAGAVVTRDVPDYGFVMGVPGEQVGWMSRHGHRLEFGEGSEAVCPESRFRYQLSREEEGESRIRCLDLDEEDPLPDTLATGSRTYRQFREAR